MEWLLMSGGERRICAKLGNSGRATHLCQGGGQGGQRAGARLGRLRGRTSHDLSRYAWAIRGQQGGTHGGTWGSHAWRHVGIPKGSQGLICKCVQAFLFHFTKFMHVIIFSTKARRNSMKYDLFVYQRKTLIVVVPPTKLDRHA
jgi:hypothetical protein